MERMTVYRLMQWLATKPAGSEVQITIPGASEPVDIFGLDVDPDFGTLLLEADSPEFDTDDDDEEEDES